MKIYCPNQKDAIGGGWTFLRNFKKALANKVHFVDSWKECDVFFITGITMVDKNELYEAKKAGKKIVLRVDNVPRKSRNRRSSPHERLKEFAGLSDVVIYQSEWAKNYCYPLCGEGTVIYNGVDTEIFKADKSEPEEDRKDRYLFAYHGKSELKQFWLAHYCFQMEHRKNPNAIFWFVNDFGNDLNELVASNFDFWNGEQYMHLPKQTDPKDMAELMQQCKYLIYPSVCDSSPNLVLEARACGMEVLYPASKEFSGTAELLDPKLDISLERMGEEYFGVLQLLSNE